MKQHSCLIWRGKLKLKFQKEVTDNVNGGHNGGQRAELNNSENILLFKRKKSIS